MKSLLLSVSLFLPLTVVFGQFAELSQGAGYANSVYLDLGTGEQTAVALTDWDFAFNVGGRSFGILINEGVSSSMANPQREVELYATSDTDFLTADTANIVGRLYNGETSWEDGAFNAAANAADPFDLGWGSYSPATQTGSGSRVFFVKDRSNNYNKVFIQSLAGGTYTFIHGPLDGSSIDTVTVSKTDFIGKTLAYFSFNDGVVDLEPSEWDLLFTRYVTPIPDGENILDYTVTGVLQNEGVSVAKLNGVDPETITPPTEADAFSDNLTGIGYDWKTFNLETFTWSTPSDLVYFIETPDRLYRLQFIDFTGSSSGTTTFALNNEGTTATTTLPATINRSIIYPNPAQEQATFEIESQVTANDLRLEVIDVAGRTLIASRVRALNIGLNQIPVNLTGLPSGNYFVRLSGSTGTLTQHLVKQ